LEATKLEELEMDEDAGTESMTVAVPGRGLTKVTINTTKIQEKAQAARGVSSDSSILPKFERRPRRLLPLSLRLRASMGKLAQWNFLRHISQ
jgi:hypothetical protein